MNLSDFDYDLPEEFIAQEPVEPRDSSKLMILNRQEKSIQHRIFRDIIDYITPSDVLVMNDTRVIPARIPAQRQDTGGKLEVLLLRQIDDLRWSVLIGGKRPFVGMQIGFPGAELQAEVTALIEDSEIEISFSEPVNNYLDEIGEAPLPPYIHKPIADPERYQTIYSRYEGSAAAPTAGLHFTPDLLIGLRNKGVKFAYCTLHIGLDTFLPVRENDITQHKIHSERAVLTAENAKIINDTKLAGGRIIAVGTTTARTLETAGVLSAGGDPSDPSAVDNMCPWRPVIAFERDTELYIYPGYKWRVVDAIITNFHLPKSSLMMMVASFAGRGVVLDAYEEAKANMYRFYSFGDAMLLV